MGPSLCSDKNVHAKVRFLRVVAKIGSEIQRTAYNPRGRGGTLIFSYIHRLGLFFGVQNFEFNYFWGFQKNEFFWGYEDLVDNFGVITKLN